MQIHNVKRKHENKKSKLIGRGGGRGTYSGRGVKGQKAHAGRKIRPEIRDIIKKIPKKRGYRFASIQDKPQIVDIAALNRFFDSGDTITPQTLVSKGVLRRGKSATLRIKILGGESLSKKLTVSGCAISKSARREIEKAGGTVK